MPNTVVDPASLPAWYWRSYPEDEPCRWEPVLTVVAGAFDRQLPDGMSVEQFERHITPQIDATPGAYLKTRRWQRVCLRCEHVHDVGEECDDEPDLDWYRDR